MKILEVCPYSAGGCGVWARAREESVRLVKRGHTVRVFSTNFEKGTNKIVPAQDTVEGVQIQRFPALMPGKDKLKFLPGGESYMFFNFIKEAIDYSPDIIIAHNYRQFLTEMALRVAHKLNNKGKKCKIFLVTHAPFPEGDITRTFWGHSAAWFYDFFIGRFSLKKFDKILAISHWEIPLLEKCGAPQKNIVYIPNGIPEEFFKQKKAKEQHKIIFLGRVAPKKKIETIIEAIPYIEDKKIMIEIVGPSEKEYFDVLQETIKKLNVKKRIIFSGPVYDLQKKIKKIDSAKIYVLASRVEGMPQSLIEAMAREKIVIGSNSIAIRDLIQDKKNGYLFEFDNPKDLAEKINLALKQKNKKISPNAKKSTEQYRWDKIIKKIEQTINA